MSAGFGMLAGVAIASVAVNIYMHLGPSIHSGQVFECLRSARMSCSGGLMMLLHEVQPQWLMVGDPDSLSVQEKVVSFFAFCQSDVLALFDSIAEHLKDLGWEGVYGICFMEVST
jgi:hypothetical protein